MNERKILIVEDERKLADTLKKGLEENGYCTKVAYDGHTGRQLIAGHQFDLIMLDINLPGINGYELCRLIRAGNNSVAVIMLTSLITLNDKIDGYKAGTDDYIVKPFEFRELLLKIGALLKRSTGTLLRAADLEMNVDTRKVTRAGQKIILTPKEFQLLEYLLRNKNRAVTRPDIAVNVWDAGFDIHTNVIDVYISYISDKIDRLYPNKLIQVMNGPCYMLKESES